MPKALLEAAASPRGAGMAVPEGLRRLRRAAQLPPAHPFSSTDLLTGGQGLDPTALHPAL